MRLVDEFPDYPLISDKDFKDTVVSRKEFLDNSKDNNLLEHQKIIKRFLAPNTPYDSQLLYHGLGTGKTCSSIAVAENYKNIQGRNKALVIVGSDVLKQNYINELAGPCTGGIYQGIIEEYEIVQDRAKVRRTNKKVGKNYELTTYETFAKIIDNTPSSKMIEDYSDRIIVIDEAHSLREHKTKDDKKSIYSSFHRFLHYVKNCKILLLTGTPIWDQANEISSLMNLIIPLDKQLSSEKDFEEVFFDKEGKLIDEDELKDLFQGRVSYIREESDAKRIDMGEITKLKYTKVIDCPMSEKQLEVYKTLKQKKQGILIDKAAVSDFVFEDNTFGINGFKKNVKRNKNSKKTILPTFLMNLRNIKNIDERIDALSIYSTKFATCIRNILNDRKEGRVCFVYSPSVKGSGLLLLGAILRDVFRFTEVLHTTGEMNDIVDGNRFMTITGEVGSASISKMIERFNNVNNKYGNQIGVILASDTISQGISLKNIRAVNILRPHWNLSKTDQIEGRAFRYNSHISLSKEERNIKVYKYVSSHPTKIGIDYHTYKIAEVKDFKAAQIKRLLKEIATDCSFHKERNIREIDTDYSRVCDYDICNYTCDISLKEPISNTTYNLFYSENDINKIIKRLISNVFNQYSSLDLDSIIDRISTELGLDKDAYKDLIIVALTRLVSEKIEITSQYGIKSYLKEDYNIYFIDKYPTESENYLSSFYTTNLKRYSKRNLKDFITRKSKKKSIEKMCEFVKNPLKDIIDYNTKIVLYENLILNQLSEVEKKVLDNMKDITPYILLDDRRKVHINYYLGFRAHTVANPKIIPMGYTRVTNSQGNWRYLYDIQEETKILNEIKNKKEIQPRNNIVTKGGVTVTFNNNGSYNIKSSVSKRGQNCKTISKERLLIAVIESGYNKIPVNLKDKTRTELETIVKSDTLYDTIDTDSKTDDQLRSLLLPMLSKSNACDEFKLYFED